MIRTQSLHSCLKFYRNVTIGDVEQLCKLHGIIWGIWAGFSLDYPPFQSLFLRHVIIIIIIIIKQDIFMHMLQTNHIRNAYNFAWYWVIKFCCTHLLFPWHTNGTFTLVPFELSGQCEVIIIITIIIQYVCLLSQTFLPGTSLEPAVIPTAQASSFTLQYFPYYVWCAKYSCLLYYYYYYYYYYYLTIIN